MAKEFIPDDAVIPKPTCIYCCRECKKNEVVWTGDSNSYDGFELWCYCEHCETDMFKKITKID